MNLIFVGSGSGKTSLSRYHSSLLFQSKEENVLIDAGDGISRALKARKIPYDSIGSIIFSHYHADHFGGIASLITQMYLENRKNRLRIFTHKELIKPLISYLHSTYLFEDKLGFVIEYEGFTFRNKNGTINSLNFEARRNKHVKNTSNPSVTRIAKYISSSFLFYCLGKQIFYTSDIGSVKDLYLFKNHKINYFISEAAHVSVEEIYRGFESSGAQKLILTHFDEDIHELEVWYNNLDDIKKARVIFAYDGYKLKI